MDFTNVTEGAVKQEIFADESCSISANDLEQELYTTMPGPAELLGEEGAPTIVQDINGDSIE